MPPSLKSVRGDHLGGFRNQFMFVGLFLTDAQFQEKLIVHVDKYPQTRTYMFRLNLFFSYDSFLFSNFVRMVHVCLMIQKI